MLNEDPCQRLVEVAKSLQVDDNSFETFDSVKNDPEARILSAIWVKADRCWTAFSHMWTATSITEKRI